MRVDGAGLLLWPSATVLAFYMAWSITMPSSTMSSSKFTPTPKTVLFTQVSHIKESCSIRKFNRINNKDIFFWQWQTLAWTGSLSYALQCVFCIIGSILVDFFNPRVIGVIGGFISALSMLLSAQAQEIQIYIFTYGILLAIGQALLLASTLAILPHYFNKKLSLANGTLNKNS